MSNYNNEIAPGIPGEVLNQKYDDGEPIAYEPDYDCVLLERKLSKGYSYTGFNRTNGRKLKLGSRKDLPMEEHVLNMLTVIRNSDITGIGRLQADRPVGEQVNAEKAKEILNTAISKALSELNYYDVDVQKNLAGIILDTLIQHDMLPIEAESNELNIMCCLISAVIAKRGRMNDFYTRNMYPEMQYSDMPKTPIVVSVPSTTLQRKIVKELLPEISKMLLESGIIRDTIDFVERKGRGSYVCARKAKNYLPVMRHKNRRKKLDKLLKGDAVIDLADIEGLSHSEKNAISVDSSCSWTCSNYVRCKFIEYLEMIKSYAFDIQVCTHRYLLSDMFKRISGNVPLIPNYQALIIFDTYNYLQVAAEMHRIEISASAIPDIVNEVHHMTFRRTGLSSIARATAKKLSSENTRMFKWLVGISNRGGNEVYTIVTLAGTDIVRHLKNIRDIADRLVDILYNEAFLVKAEELLRWVGEKYGADTTPIDLNKILSAHTPDENMLKLQVTALCGAICNLRAVKRCLSTEKVTKQKKGFDKSTARRPYAKYAHNTESEAIYNVNSEIKALIWEKARCLLRPHVSMGYRSESILNVINDIKHIRNKADAIVKQDIYDCRVKVHSEVSRLYAVPKNIGKKLFSEQRERGIPTVLMSGKLPEDIEFADFEQIVGY